MPAQTSGPKKQESVLWGALTVCRVPCLRFEQRGCEKSDFVGDSGLPSIVVEAFRSRLRPTGTAPGDGPEASSFPPYLTQLFLFSNLYFVSSSHHFASALGRRALTVLLLVLDYY